MFIFVRKLNKLNKDSVFEPIEIEMIFKECIENVKVKFLPEDEKETMSVTLNSEVS